MTVTNTAIPVISGTAQAGHTLTTDHGSWTFDEDFLTYAYQWERCDAAGLNCVDISGATSNQFALTNTDVGHTLRSRVTATEHAAAPPPSGSAYFETDYSGGLIGPPWTAMFSYAPPGFVDLTQTGPQSGTSDGRVAVANDPAGSGDKVVRFEIRDSDPSWPVPLNPAVDKSEVRSTPSYTWNAAQAAYGDERWFSLKYYLPYNVTEKFEWAHGGGNAFIDLNDMHPDNNSWPAMQIGWYPQTDPQWAKLRMGGGPVVGATTYYGEYNLWQLTNSSGSRIAANHNRWLTVVLGVKFNYTNAGWIQAYVDGTQVLSQTFRPTMWKEDFGMYWKGGLYKQANAVFPETGRSVIYWGTTLIGLTQSDVM